MRSRVLHVQQRQAAVVLEVAGIEGADHRHLLEARHDAGRRDLPAGRDQRDGVAGAHAQAARQLRRRARCRTSPAPAAPACPAPWSAARSVTCGSRAGSMPRTMAPRMSSPRASRDCAATKGAAPTTSGFARASRSVRCTSGSTPPPGPVDLDVRDDAQHAVAHFLLEAVHHRQHDDQRSHAQRDAEHRDAGDEGDEAVAAGGAPGPGVAPAQRQLVGDAHGTDQVWAALWHPRTIAAMSDGAPLVGSLRRERGTAGADRRWPACALPHLEQLLGRLEPAAALDDGEHALSMPHERVLAARLRPAGARRPASPGPPGRCARRGGDPGADGLGLDHALPLARGHRPRRDAPPAGPAARCGRIAGAAGRDAALLRAGRHRAAVRRRPRAGWRAATCSRGLATASLDRVIGRVLDPWMPRGDASRPLRRLQQEMQMLLYTHPVNEERTRGGLLPVNSFWVSGSGALPDRLPASREPRACRSPTTCAMPPCCRTGAPGPRPGSSWTRGMRAPGQRAGRRPAGGPHAVWRTPRTDVAKCRDRRGDGGSPPCGRAAKAARIAGRPMKIIPRDIPPRAAWALEQAGIHPLLARLYAARGVLAQGGTRRRPGAPAAAGRPEGRGGGGRAAGRCHRAAAPHLHRGRLRLRRRHRLRRRPCAACACWARATSTTWCPTAWSTATASPPSIAQRVKDTRRRPAGHRGQRHRQRRGRRHGQRAGPAGARDRPPPARRRSCPPRR